MQLEKGRDRVAEAEIKGQRDNGLGVSLRRAGKAELPDRSILQSPPQASPSGSLEHHPQQALFEEHPTSLGLPAQISISGPARQIAAGGTMRPMWGKPLGLEEVNPCIPIYRTAREQMTAAGSAHASLTVR